MTICRHCGRPIERSPASGLWWANDGQLTVKGCMHEPQDSEEE